MNLRVEEGLPVVIQSAAEFGIGRTFKRGRNFMFCHHFCLASLSQTQKQCFWDLG